MNHFFHQFLGDADVVLGDFVANAAGAGMQKCPYLVVLVVDQLDEVVP